MEVEESESYDHSHAFFTSLGYELLAWIKNHGLRSSTHTLQDVASSFRSYMTEGMTVGSHNETRIDFYDRVLKRAKKVGTVLLFSSCLSTIID